MDDKAQLELTLGWEGLEGAAARVAGRLRVRVLTWDPLGWVDDREPAPVVAVEGAGSGYQITLYLGAWTLDTPLLGTVAVQLSALGHSILRVGALHEASLISGEWAGLEREGLLPPLLGALRIDGTGPVASVELSRDWWPIDEATVASIVAGDFGPVDLDLVPRPLSARTPPAPGCPACSGRAFAVPFQLDLARPEMCRPHRAEALALMARATAQAEESNPEGWEVFCHAAADLLPYPHVPYPIRHRLVDAAAGVSAGPGDHDLLGEQADSLLAFVAWVATPERLEAAMSDLGWRPLDSPFADDGRFVDFAHQVAYELGDRGSFDAAGRAVEAVATVLPRARANLEGQLAVQLAEAGQLDEARRRMAVALADPSCDLLTLTFAGEIDEHAGDAAAAEDRYRSTLARARAEGDTLFEHELLWHLIELLQDDDERADEVRALVAERERAHRSMQREGDGPAGPAGAGSPPKVGRNDPCPCGSGSKFKHCHGSAGR